MQTVNFYRVDPPPPILDAPTKCSRELKVNWSPFSINLHRFVKQTRNIRLRWWLFQCTWATQEWQMLIIKTNEALSWKWCVCVYVCPCPVTRNNRWNCTFQFSFKVVTSWQKPVWWCSVVLPFPKLAGKYIFVALSKHPDFVATNKAGKYHLDGGLLTKASHNLHPFLPMRKSVNNNEWQG